MLIRMTEATEIQARLQAGDEVDIPYLDAMVFIANGEAEEVEEADRDSLLEGQADE